MIQNFRMDRGRAGEVEGHFDSDEDPEEPSPGFAGWQARAGAECGGVCGRPAADTGSAEGTHGAAVLLGTLVWGLQSGGRGGLADRESVKYRGMKLRGSRARVRHRHRNRFLDEYKRSMARHWRGGPANGPKLRHRGS